MNVQPNTLALKSH